VPNSAYLLKQLDNSDCLRIGNALYNITFENRNVTAFGFKYSFELNDAIDGCPEYIVPIKEFQRMAAIHGLTCVLYKPFHEFFSDQWKEDFQLMERMGIFDENGTIDQLQWDASGIYSVFAFKKV
jgi:mRNA (guanine-N7-)-methyltransferase